MKIPLSDPPLSPREQLRESLTFRRVLVVGEHPKLTRESVLAKAHEDLLGEHPKLTRESVLAKAHEDLYSKPREEFNLLSKIAEDCYRDALTIYRDGIIPKRIDAYISQVYG
ncbi:hypothetical protein GCM10007116_12990 [Sulfodiicoccus acidiphilus]|nr:hypothetical protein GCM10007116_12990 [Sulfodiicoccus acidiphilus]